MSVALLGTRARKIAPATSEALFATVAVIALLQGIAPELTMLVRNSFTDAMRSESSATFASRDGRSFPFNSFKAAATVSVLVKSLDAISAPGDRLFVGPADLRRTNYSDTYLYHLLPKLTPATYFLEMNPESANRPGSRLAADVATADWLVLNKAWDPWNEPNRSILYGSNAPNAVVQRDFVPRGEFGTFTVFQRKTPRSRVP